MVERLPISYCQTVTATIAKNVEVKEVIFLQCAMAG